LAKENNTMRTLGWRYLTIGVLAMMVPHGPARACEVAGPDTHIGTITAIARERPSLTIVDMQTNEEITFQVRREQLQDLKPGQRVAVKYSRANGRLNAEQITPR